GPWDAAAEGAAEADFAVGFAQAAPDAEQFRRLQCVVPALAQDRAACAHALRRALAGFAVADALLLRSEEQPCVGTLAGRPFLPPQPQLRDRGDARRVARRTPLRQQRHLLALRTCARLPYARRTAGPVVVVRQHNPLRVCPVRYNGRGVAGVPGVA